MESTVLRERGCGMSAQAPTQPTNSTKSKYSKTSSPSSPQTQHHQHRCRHQPSATNTASIIAVIITPSTESPPSTSHLLCNNLLPIPRIPRLRRARGPGVTPKPTSFFKREKNCHGPPLSMITQGYYATPLPTKNWVAQQSLTLHNESEDVATRVQPAPPPSIHRSTRVPLVESISPLEPSSSVNLDMSLQPSAQERGHTHLTTEKHESHNDEPVSAEGNVFVKTVENEELAKQSDLLGYEFPNLSQLSRMNFSPTPQDVIRSSALARCRGYRFEGVVVSPSLTRPEARGKALTYTPLSSSEKTKAGFEMIKSLPHEPNSSSMPSTPQSKCRDITLSAPHIAFGERRLSAPCALPLKYSAGTSNSKLDKIQNSYDGTRSAALETVLPVRKGGYHHRQPSGRPPAFRTYNSSPLAPRSAELHDSPAIIRRQLEDTESTVSTTAQSAVWDELEDLKSRIQRLELSEKPAPSPGTANSRTSNERPPTATTTVTSMSTSPKPDRANSRSPTPQLTDIYGGSEVNHLLKSALIKSKPIISPEVYRALDATASDAIAIASMMGSSGQQGPISSSQSSFCGIPAVSDRQVRRKAESMLRSLTELCLALSEGKPESESPNEASTDSLPALETATTQSRLASPRSISSKSSPQALSRLEARRSSLLSPGISSRLTPSSQSVTPAPQNSIAARRTSLFFRGTQGSVTTESEKSTESRLRVPVRSYSDLNSAKNTSRERAFQLPFSERNPTAPSSLPLMRHHTSVSLTPVTVLPLPGLSDRRKLERSTQERDRELNGFVRKQRIMSLGHPVGLEPCSLTRRMRLPSAAGYSPAGRTGDFN